MAWRDPIFCFYNLFRDAAAVTPTPAEESGYPVERLWDDQITPVFTHDYSASNPQVVIDRGASIDGEDCDRFIIGPGWGPESSYAFVLQEDDNSSFTSPTALGSLSMLSKVSERAYSLSLLQDQTERYMRWYCSGTLLPEQTEVWITQDRTLEAGPDPRYTKHPTSNITESETMSGTTWRVRRSASREVLEMTFEYLDSDDVAIFDDLLEVTLDGLYPFWFFPPDDALDPIFVELIDDIRRIQSSRNPKATGEFWDITVRMRERIA